jgi:CHASE2 domain-containing sensor protein
VALVALAAVLALAAGGLLRPLQDAVQDRYVAWTAPRRATPVPVVLVAVDEPSLQERGPWPWPRIDVAALVDRIADRDPAVLALDVMLAGRPAGADAAVEELRSALSRVPRVVLPVAAVSGRTEAAAWRELLEWPREMVPPGALAGHTLLPGSGDAGNGAVCRGLSPELRLPAERPGGPERVFRPLAVVAAEALEPGITTPHPGARELLRIRYVDPVRPGYRRVSAVSLLDGSAAVEELRWLRGSLVFLGGTAAGLPDFRATPVGDLAGVDIQAQAAAMLLRGERLSPLTPLAPASLAALLALAVAWPIVAGRLGAGILVAASSAVLLAAGVLLALTWTGGWFDPVVPGTTLGLTVAAALLLRSRTSGEALQRRDRQVSVLWSSADELTARSGALAGVAEGTAGVALSLPGVDGAAILLADPVEHTFESAHAGDAGDPDRLWREGHVADLLGGERAVALDRTGILSHHWIRLAAVEATEGAVLVGLGSPPAREGLLLVTTRRPGGFPREETAALSTLASQAALAARGVRAAGRGPELLEELVTSRSRAIELRAPASAREARRVELLVGAIAAELGGAAAEREIGRCLARLRPRPAGSPPVEHEGPSGLGAHVASLRHSLEPLAASLARVLAPEAPVAPGPICSVVAVAETFRALAAVGARGDPAAGSGAVRRLRGAVRDPADARAVRALARLHREGRLPGDDPDPGARA